MRTRAGASRPRKVEPRRHEDTKNGGAAARTKASALEVRASRHSAHSFTLAALIAGRPSIGCHAFAPQKHAHRWGRGRPGQVSGTTKARRTAGAAVRALHGHAAREPCHPFLIPRFLVPLVPSIRRGACPPQADALSLCTTDASSSSATSSCSTSSRSFAARPSVSIRAQNGQALLTQSGDVFSS